MLARLIALGELPRYQPRELAYVTYAGELDPPDPKRVGVWLCLSQPGHCDVLLGAGAIRRDHDAATYEVDVRGCARRSMPWPADTSPAGRRRLCRRASLHPEGDQPHARPPGRPRPAGRDEHSERHQAPAGDRDEYARRTLLRSEKAWRARRVSDAKTTVLLLSATEHDPSCVRCPNRLEGGCSTLTAAGRAFSSIAISLASDEQRRAIYRDCGVPCMPSSWAAPRPTDHGRLTDVLDAFDHYLGATLDDRLLASPASRPGLRAVLGGQVRRTIRASVCVR